MSSVFSGDPFATIAFAESLEAASSLDGDAENPFFVRMRGLAAELLATYGSTIKIRRKNTTLTSDPLAPYETGFTDYSRRALVVGYSAEKVDGDRIMASDRRVIMDCKNLAITPRGDDMLILGGIHHGLVQIKPIPTIGTISLYILQARVM
jgi:hypothetical protein